MSDTTEKIKSFTDLRVWRESHQLALEVYRATDEFPDNQKFGLTNQLQRAVVSISSNIAEGFGRPTPKDQAHFLYVALSSVNETQSQLLLSRDLGYLPSEEFDRISRRSVIIHKMLNGLIKANKAR